MTACVLVVVASLLVPLGLVTVWMRAQVLDTDAFVGTAGRVAGDPTVRSDVSDRVSTALIDQLDVDARVEGGARSLLPERLQGLAGSLAAGADAAIRRATAEVVASSRFEDLWEVAVRRAHEHALRLAEGESVAGLEARNGRIVVNLDPIVDAVVARLPGPIAALVPPVTTGDDIVLLRSSDLASAQPVVRALDDGWWWIPLLCIGLYAAAIAVAPRRRPAMLGVGLGVVVSSVATFVALVVTRQRLLDATDTRVARATTGAVFDAVGGLLARELWATAGVGVALVAAAVVLGFLEQPRPIGASAEPDDSDARPLGPAEGTASSRTPTPAPGRAEGEASGAVLEPSRAASSGGHGSRGSAS